MEKIKLEVTEYKGNKLLTFSTEGDRYPFSFGIAKARKISAYIEQNGIDAFLLKLVEFTGETTEEKPLDKVNF